LVEFIVDYLSAEHGKRLRKPYPSFAPEWRENTMQVTTTFDLGAECNVKKNHPVIPDHLIKTPGITQPGTTDNALQYVLKQAK